MSFTQRPTQAKDVACARYRRHSYSPGPQKAKALSITQLHQPCGSTCDLTVPLMGATVFYRTLLASRNHGDIGSMNHATGMLATILPIEDAKRKICRPQTGLRGTAFFNKFKQPPLYRPLLDGMHSMCSYETSKDLGGIPCRRNGQNSPLPYGENFWRYGCTNDQFEGKKMRYQHL